MASLVSVSLIADGGMMYAKRRQTMGDAPKEKYKKGGKHTDGACLFMIYEFIVMKEIPISVRSEPD